MMINMSGREAKALVEFIEQNLVAHCCDSEKVDIDSLCDITDVYRRCKEFITPKKTGECANDNAVEQIKKVPTSDEEQKIIKAYVEAMHELANELKMGYTPINTTDKVIRIYHKALDELVEWLIRKKKENSSTEFT